MTNPPTVFEYKPHFHEWATVLPGMICLSRKARNATFRNYVAAETATPVIGCCACLTNDDAKNFYFAGVCRSKTVRPIDDGVGPQMDEFFTLAIGGMVTHAQQLGTGRLPRRHARVVLLQREQHGRQSPRSAKRDARATLDASPSRLPRRRRSASSAAASAFAKPMDTFDLLLKSC